MSFLSTAFIGFFAQIPKVGLHCHLLGVVRRERAPLSEAEIEGFYTRREKLKALLLVRRVREASLIKQPADLSRLVHLSRSIIRRGGLA